MPCFCWLYSTASGRIEDGLRASAHLVQTAVWEGPVFSQMENFWAFVNGDEADFYACPNQYFCGKSGGCLWQGTPHYEADYNPASVCQGNRNPAVPLCGSCLPGFSQPAGSVGDATYISMQLLY